MASEDLLKKAVAAFNALSPDQQSEMLEEQRQSWVRGNIGLSRDERGMTSTVMHRPAPAATDTGLETVAWEKMDNMRDPNDKLVYEVKFPRNGDKRLVYKSQADKLLAAERAEHDNTIATLTSLITDNAAKDARIKELEEYFAKCISNETFLEQDARRVRQIEALEAKLETYHEEYENRKEGYEKTIDSLEAKLAAAEKALEPFADHANDRAVDDTGWRDKDTVKIVVSIGDLRKARAVLGGKPS